MMKLSAMWAVNRTIDPSGRSPLAREIASRWRHDPETVKFFRSSANFVYVVRRNGGPCFLRFAPASERHRAEIEAEVDLLRWLDQEGLPVVQPISSRHGRFVETIESEQGVFHSVMLAALMGTQYDVDELDNLVWRDQTAQMLDFDDCKLSWFAYDVALALRDRFDAGANFDDARVRAFLASYSHFVTLPPDDSEHIPVFSRLARLLQYAKIARTLDLEPAPDHPAWLTGLIGRLRARMQAYETSLQTR